MPTWELQTGDGMARLEVCEIGEGDTTIVVLHGGPGSHYGYLVDAAAGNADLARFVLFDQRGSLRSPVADTDVERLNYRQLIDDLESLRIALGQDRLILLAHSWGGLLAQLYALAHPDRVQGLILVGTYGPRTPSPGWEDRVEQRRQLLSGRPSVVAALAAAGLDRDDLSTEDAASARHLTGTASFCLYRIDRWRLLGSAHFTWPVARAIDASLPASYDATAILDRLPVAVIQGDQDYLDPSASEWRDLARRGSQIKVDVIADAGHVCWVDDPDRFRECLAAAITRITAH